MFSATHFHPMMVHFPIAIIIIGFLADLAGVFFRKDKCLTKMGYWLEIVGMITAILAFGTGYFFTNPMEGEAGLAREQHEFFATFTLITIILATLFRIVINYLKKEESNLKYLSLGLFFLGFVFVSITGYLGGTLVLDYMIGM
ncbi:MAG: DUF2231 domain-containing protein [Bacteroidales bacterium]|nr:DUF2231 domain-containing protein [Bacteroidales bacterium]MDD4603996.1 DUF2231 domain-containing protein [Bacteroidales bacterium]